MPKIDDAYFHMLAANEHDPVAWQNFADHLDECGLPHLAKAARQRVGKDTDIAPRDIDYGPGIYFHLSEGGHHGVFVWPSAHYSPSWEWPHGIVAFSSGNRILGWSLAQTKEHTAALANELYQYDLGHNQGNKDKYLGSSHSEIHKLIDFGTPPPNRPKLLARCRQAIRMSKRRPVRLAAESEAELLMKAIAANPNDRKHWHALADHMDELGKPHTAAGLRKIATDAHDTRHPNRTICADSRFRAGLNLVRSSHPDYEVNGRVGGVWTRLNRFTDGTWFLAFGHHDKDNRSHRGVLWGLPPEHGKGIISEFDQPGRLSRGRPVRLATKNEAVLLLKATERNPGDRQAWHALADHMDELGKPYFASSLRSLANNGKDIDGDTNVVGNWHNYGTAANRPNLIGSIAGIKTQLEQDTNGQWVMTLYRSGKKPLGLAYSHHAVHWSLPKEHGEGIVSEFDQPEQPVAKMSREDTPALLAATRANPGDKQTWHALADHVDELGKPRLAAGLRQLANEGDLSGPTAIVGDFHGTVHYLGDEYANELEGHIAGIGIRAERAENGKWVVSIGHHSKRGSDHHGVIWGLSDENVNSLLNEFDEPAQKRQFSRQGPVRMSRQDMPALLAAIEGDVHNDAHWHALADAMDEAGKPWTATLLRDWANWKELPAFNGYRRRSREIDPAENCRYTAWGARKHVHIAGVPFTINDEVNGAQSVFHLSHGYPHPGIAYLPPKYANSIKSEIDQDEEPRPQRMSRQDIPALYAAVQSDPHNRGHWHALADAFDEVGKPHLAAAIREIGVNGEEGFDPAGSVPEYLHTGNYEANYVRQPQHGGELPEPGEATGEAAGVPIEVRHLHNNVWFFGFGKQPTGGVWVGGRVGTHWGMPQEQAHGIAKELDQTEKMRRGAPVRLAAESEAELLMRAISADPHNDQQWHALADHMDEQGKPHFAAALRKLAVNKPMANFSHYKWVNPERFGLNLGQAARSKGTIAGVSVLMSREGDGEPWLLAIKRSEGIRSSVGYIYLPPYHGALVHNEIDNFEGQVPYYEDVARLQSEANRPRPTQMARGDTPEPDLNEYIRHRFADNYGLSQPGDPVTQGTGWILRDGTPVNMGSPQMRHEDHRASLPFHREMVAWGWSPAITDQYAHGSRGLALIEMIRRSGAIRIHVSEDEAFLHSMVPWSGRQKAKVAEYVHQNRPKSLQFEHGDRSSELEYPDMFTLEEHVNQLGRRPTVLSRIRGAVRLTRSFCANAQNPIRLGMRDNPDLDDAWYGKQPPPPSASTSDPFMDAMEGKTPSWRDPLFDPANEPDEATWHPGVKPPPKQSTYAPGAQPPKPVSRVQVIKRPPPVEGATGRGRQPIQLPPRPQAIGYTPPQTFHYQAIDAAGNRVGGSVQAYNESHARSLVPSHHFVTQISTQLPVAQHLPTALPIGAPIASRLMEPPQPFATHPMKPRAGYYVDQPRSLSAPLPSMQEQIARRAGEPLHMEPHGGMHIPIAKRLGAPGPAPSAYRSPFTTPQVGHFVDAPTSLRSPMPSEASRIAQRAQEPLNVVKIGDMHLPVAKRLQRAVQMARQGEPIRLATPSSNSWFAWDTFLGRKQDRPVGNNRRLIRLPNGDIAARLHGTHVVIAHGPNSPHSGKFTLNSGGWTTRTTESAIREFSPARVSIVRRNGTPWFYDGVMVDHHGDPVWNYDEEVRDMLDRHRHYGGGSRGGYAVDRLGHLATHLFGSAKGAQTREALLHKIGFGGRPEVDEEEDAMMNAVLGDPHNDQHWFQYADWLDEHGKPERAHSVRSAIQMAPEPPDYRPDSMLPEDYHMRQTGQPVRLSRQDIPGLLEAIKSNHKNSQYWHALADAMDEAGKPHAAEHFRRIAEEGESRFHRVQNWRWFNHTGDSFHPNDTGDHHIGSIAGVPFDIKLSHKEPKHYVYAGHKNLDNATSYGLVLTPEAENLISEFDEPELAPKKLARQQPKAIQLAKRKAKPVPTSVDLVPLHSMHPEREALIHAIAANPRDHQARLALADWLEEHGETLPAARLRWWEEARLDPLHHLQLKQEGHPNSFDSLRQAMQTLQGQSGHDAVVLAGLLASHHQEELYPVDWSKLKPYHADPDGLRRQIGGASLTTELVALGVLPRDSAGAAHDSAGAAYDSAGAAHGSAGAAYDSAGAAHGSAWAAYDSAWAACNSAVAARGSAWAAHDSAEAAYSSAWAAHRSAGAAFGSAGAAHEHIVGLAHAAATDKVWQTWPKEEEFSGQAKLARQRINRVRPLVRSAMREQILMQKADYVDLTRVRI